MKAYIAGFAAIALLAGAGVGSAYAQDSTTVVHKESADGDKSKTVIKKDDGSKTVVKRHGATVKKTHTDAEGDKTVVKKTTE
jgi:hypothetical protein